MRINDTSDLSRRHVLQTVGAGLGTAGVATSVSGSSGNGHIVGFSNGADVAAATDRALGATQQLDLGSVRSVVVGEFDRGDLQALQNNLAVDYVERDGTMRALDVGASVVQSDDVSTQETAPYGIDITEADAAINQGATGDSVTISVVDTGIDVNHETLGENIIGGYAVSGVECSGGGCDAPDDDQYHGTHVAGTAAAAKTVSNCSGSPRTRTCSR